uniref:Uncharacterized protein n=1 Tax=Amphimedon queenslandica TaxID=400682 RepID=A0A1X7UD96_AMPQE
MVTKSDKRSPCQCRHLDFILQFTTNIRYVYGPLNPVADALSRIELYQLSSSDTPPVIKFEDMALAPGDCQFLSEETPTLSIWNNFLFVIVISLPVVTLLREHPTQPYCLHLIVPCSTNFIRSHILTFVLL